MNFERSDMKTTMAEKLLFCDDLEVTKLWQPFHGIFACTTKSMDLIKNSSMYIFKQTLRINAIDNPTALCAISKAIVDDVSRPVYVFQAQA